ncbi:MAG: hypothetical protein IKG75_04095, partial [Bacteroidaceae bacterium]|nr:hypothetical protein [Bacteroidaceae bacterium]
HTLTRLSDGKVFSLKDLGAVAPVVEAGGMFAYARKEGMIPSAAHLPEQSSSHPLTATTHQRKTQRLQS